MLEIRRLVTEGYNYEQIREVLGIPRRSFYRYLNRVFEDDRRALQEKNSEELQRQLCILQDRYSSILQELRTIATDTTQSAADRMDALHSMASLSLTIAKLYGDAPTISAMQARKLKAIKEGPLTFPREGFVLPSSYTESRYIWGGRAKSLEDLSTQPPQPEEEQQEEEPASDEEDQDIFDHEFTRNSSRRNERDS